MLLLIGQIIVLSFCATRVCTERNVAKMEEERKALRQEMKEKGLKLEIYKVLIESSFITISLWNLRAYNNSKRIAVYLHKEGEVQTDDIVREMFVAKKRVYIPRYTDTHLDMVRIKSMRDLNQSVSVDKYGIRQPLGPEKREEALEKKGGIHMIIMPGLAFTKEGYRLGRGNGLLEDYIRRARLKGSPVLVGLAYMHQLVPKFPVSPSDIKVDYVLDSEDDSHFEDSAEDTHGKKFRFKTIPNPTQTFSLEKTTTIRSSFN